MELRGRRKCQLRRLRGHRPPDLLNAMADIHDRRLPRCIEVFTPALGKNPAAFAANGDRHLLMEMAREKSGVV